MNIEHENDLNAASSKYMVHFPGMMIAIDFIVFKVGSTVNIVLNLGGQQLQMGLFGPIFCRIFQWDPDTLGRVVSSEAMFIHVPNFVNFWERTKLRLSPQELLLRSL